MKEVKYLNVSYPSMVKDSRLVIFGEGSHSIPHYKEEVIRALPILKGMGFTHLAMEMLPVSLQEKVDLYNKTGKGEQHLVDHFNRHWAHGMPAAENAARYYKIVVQARNDSSSLRYAI
ncbi:hypothetical protein HC752_01780 [Vibrio sp. S9_S30]|uniref:hypothetical protein n=1 Tax=Vibrio sp. S9_S30 TaxID=2720226 RepID=UPI0016808EF1|nr:hypothetical protein [Vibrio sp. S9_S30]MBD1555664.1 hypothetical protein [Vibrio sp. S9_S30]